MQVVEQGQEVRYVVEKVDPHAERPDLTDETRDCSGVLAALNAKRHWESLTGQSHAESYASIQLVIGGEPVTHTDPETGVEVTARRS